MASPIIRPIISVPRVAGIEGFHCTYNSPFPDNAVCVISGSEKDSKMKLVVLENGAPSAAIFTFIGTVLQNCSGLLCI